MEEITTLIKNTQNTDNNSLSKIGTAMAGKELLYQLFSKHSQEQELEADACSLRILTSINNKNKEKYIQELVKNIDLTIQNEDDYKDRFITIQEHPNKEQRIENIKKLSKTL